MSNLKKWGGAIALFALVAAASAASYQRMSSRSEREPGVAAGRKSATSLPASYVTQPGGGAPGGLYDGTDQYIAGNGINTPATSSIPGQPGRSTYIVLYKEAALASYKGGTAGIAAPKRRVGAVGKYRLDTKSAEARSYVGYLEKQQLQMERQMSRSVAPSLLVRKRMQYAVNGIIADMTADDAARIGKLPNVRLVEGYREFPAYTDAGPALIGAPAVWDGSNLNAPGPYQGEGVVFGIIDSGINFGSPSFAGTSPADGYVHINPLGTGNYLGTCVAGGVDAGRCNSKLIGGYDFVCGAPGNQCGVANVREEPGFGDTNGHGSHTASTGAGNRRDALFNGGLRRLSGVAPHANIIAYDVCYTNTSTGQGLCPNVSSVAAVNQAIADGVVDVINFSIGGGADPWNDSVSLAFLSAVDAGIYVSASAGNSGPAANTLDHVEPWVSSTAAATHTRGPFGTLMQVTGPTPVPAALSPVTMNEGSGGTPLTASIPGTTPLRISAGISTTSDGCAAFPPGTFTGAIAVIRRGTCSFSIKANNAAAAGAIAMVIANNTTGAIAPSVPGTTIPVFGVTQLDGNALRDFGNANPTAATAQISFPSVGLPAIPDVIASFSSRGPAGAFNLLKPDVTAPGVDVLAAFAGTTITGSEQLVGLLSGTSMSSPHQAGSAMLIHQARPTWTVPEIKSALMMTATTQVYNEDTITLANAFTRGAGRIRVDKAINAGLLLDETTANFTAANPASGGNPATLNIASLQNGRCFPTCVFTRTFRNPGTSGGLWRISINGVPGSVSPSLAWILPGGIRTISFTVNSATLPPNGSWNFGEVLMELRQSGGGVDSLSTLHMPIAVSVPPPAISLPASVSASVATGSNGSTSFNIGNTGGSTLNYIASTTGNATLSVYNALRGAINSGFRNIIYTDPATAGNAAQFSADDFDVTAPTQITSLAAEGFVVSGAAFPGAATNLTWSIYPDAAGVPAGNPQSAAAAAIWTYTATPTGTGVSTAGGILSLNLTAAGQNVTLPAGKYWLVINTRGTFANRWAQFGSATGSGAFASISVAADGSGAWAANTAFAGLNMIVNGSVACGASWLGSLTPASGAVAPAAAQSTTLTLNSSSLSAASYRAYVCVTSNDPVTPSAALPINLTVTP